VLSHDIERTEHIVVPAVRFRGDGGVSAYAGLATSLANVETVTVTGPSRPKLRGLYVGPQTGSVAQRSVMLLLLSKAAIQLRWITALIRRSILFALCTFSLTFAAIFGTAIAADSATDGHPPTGSDGHIAGWTLVASPVENTLVAGEGVATVSEPGHTPYELYRGIESVPDALKTQGWTHIGDPDSIRGYIFDAYQGPSSGNSKMFLVTTPSGQSFEYVHTLVKGELYNNSFVSVSPDTLWMVAGEWGTMDHLQVYPTPLLNHRVRQGGGALQLAGYIRLDHKINDIQGCDFLTATRLVCASDDDSRTLFKNEKPLLEVDLPHSLRGSSVTGHVIDLGPIPQDSSCSGTFEAEGVDFDARTDMLRVEIIQPGSCILKTTVYEYRPTGQRH
jgi:hypothetical protein